MSWRFIDVGVGSLVRDLAQANLVDAINDRDALGAISMPLSHVQPLALPAKQIRFSTTGVNAVITLAAFSGSVHADLTRIVAMPEGLYVYATLKTGAR